MALKKNKVKYGLNMVHYAKITAWSEDGVPTFATPVRLPGAVSLSVDASGEASNFYADNVVYFVINNNAGYEGDLEVALVTTDFAMEILGELLDDKGVLVEKMTQNWHSSHSSLNLRGIKIKSAMFFTAVLQAVLKRKAAQRKNLPKSKRKRFPSNRQPCRMVS